MKLGRWWLLIIALMLVVAGWLGTALLGPPLLRQVESQLSRTLNTDVQLGTIQTVLPWQVVVGPVTIDSTLGERDLLRAPRVRVGFSLLGVVFGTGARASLSVEEPEIFLRRDQASLFNLPQLPESTDGPPLETLISRLEVRRGKFIYEDQVLGGTPITLTDLDVEADLAGGKADYTLRTRLLAGEIQAEGETGLETLETRINARLSALPADRLARVLDLGDLAVRRGTVEGNLQLGLRNGQLTGTGPLRLRGGELVLGSLPPVTTLDVDSSLAWPRLNLNRIQGRLVGARIGGTGRFELPERLLLALDVRDILLERYATALALKLPVAVQGEVNTRLNATLPFNNPRQLTVDGTLSTPGTLKVDRLVVNNLRSRYRYDGERLVAPFSLVTASGKVEGTARAQLLGKTRFEVDATGRSLLPEAVASRYGIVIPVVERSGRLNFTARIQVGDRLLGETDFQLSGGSVRNQPFTAAGNLALVGAQLTITDTRVRFPAATRAALIANGQVKLTGTRPLEVRVDIEDLPLSLASRDVGGTANGQIQVRGPLNSGGDLLGALQAEGTLVVDTPRFNTQELPTLNVAFRFEDR
ncbi:MAG: DUF748 domain-containing protein, partial [Gemmatimonadaceae bacterium]|nr:DUF748 domain-containing protein [Gloeobacterales cyanobacterium ES-bin-141]